MIAKLIAAIGTISLLVPTPALALWIPVGNMKGTDVYVNDETFSYRQDTVGFWQRSVDSVPNKQVQ